MTILLRMDDKMNRQLSCEVNEDDTPAGLADELVHHGFITLVSLAQDFAYPKILKTLPVCRFSIKYWKL